MVSEILAPISFDFALGEEDVHDVQSKIRFLYRIGFLGVKGDAPDREKLGINGEHAFVFNEGMVPFRGAIAPELSRFEFLIHPLFCEFLQLDTTNQELILVYTWQYLKDMELLMDASGSGRIS
jgi:hypothetical protein